MKSIKEFYSQPNPQVLEHYLKPIVPRLTTTALEVPLLEGSERDNLGVVTNGDASLVVMYRSKGRKRTGAVSSVLFDATDLSVVQLQGGRNGYRVTSGLHVPELFADNWQRIATHPDSGIERITMPLPNGIEGLSDAETPARARYERFRIHLGMRQSTEEQIYVKDIK